MTSLARQLRWLIGIRLVAVASVMVSLALFQLLPQAPWTEGPMGPPAPGEQPLGSAAELSPDGGPPLPFLSLLAVFVVALSGAYALLLRRFPESSRSQAYLQLSIDLVVTTVLIWSLGVGASNPFSIFYLMFIAAASFLLGRQAGFTMALMAYALYSGLVLGLNYGGLPPFGDLAPPEQSPLILAYNLFSHLFAFIAIALLTATLARRLEAAQRELAEDRQSLARLRVVHQDIVESIQSGLITTDLEGRITSINQAGSKILGRSFDDLRGTFIPDTALFDAESWALHSGITREQGVRQRAETQIQKEGQTSFIGFSISKLNDGDGEHQGYIVIFQNLTRWRELEEQVRIKDRMAAVGELAAGLAHEIGNPLASISGSVQMLRQNRGGAAEHDPPSEEIKPLDEDKLLNILHKESQRLDRTIKGFLRFARPRERSILRFDVAALLRENCDLLANSPEVQEHHRLRVDLDPSNCEIYADPDQVSQIFWNLARNGLKAMEDGGTLELRGRLRDDWYRLEVADTGIGMEERERANLFHPFKSFFDGGTGIGMAIVYRIVEEHGGRLEVTSRPDQGTRVAVELPVGGVPGSRESTGPPDAAFEDRDSSHGIEQRAEGKHEQEVLAPAGPREGAP